MMNQKENREWHYESHSKSIENISDNKFFDREIVEGTRETGQLEKLKPKNKTQENNREKQAGVSPVKSVNNDE